MRTYLLTFYDLDGGRHSTEVQAATKYDAIQGVRQHGFTVVGAKWVA